MKAVLTFKLYVSEGKDKQKIRFVLESFILESREEAFFCEY